MRIKIFMCVVSFMLIFISPCFAGKNPNAVPLKNDRMALGGLCTFDTMERVRDIYGEPDYKNTVYSQLDDGYKAVWKYGDSIEIYFAMSADKYYVQLIKTTADNGFATPDGIKVGTDEAVLRKIYGEPKFYMKNGNQAQYIYFNDTYDYVQFWFQIKNSRVDSIGLGYND